MKGAERVVFFLVVLSLLFSGGASTDVSLAAIDAQGRPSGGVVLPGTEGVSNTFFGQTAGLNTAGDNDKATFVGVGAGANNNGESNTFIGWAAGNAPSLASGNTFVGAVSGGNNNTGGNNTFVGAGAGQSNLAGDRNTFVGRAAGTLNTSGAFNTFVGDDAGTLATTAGMNTFVGHQAGYNSSTGGSNAFFGHFAGRENFTGFLDTFIGYSAGHGNTSGDYNTYVGSLVANNTNGDRNTMIGYGAGGIVSSTGSGNVFLGHVAGANEIGSDKLYIDNSNTSTPLLYGEFDNDILAVHGKLGVGTKTPATAVHMRVPLNSTMRMESSSLGGAALDFTAGPGATAFGTITNHPIIVVANSQERLRITPGGNLGVNQPAPAHPIHHINGAHLSAGGVWTSVSSASVKSNFEAVDAREVLEKLAQLPVQSWSYTAEDASIRHIGPTAEDFYAAFKLGGDEKAIGMIDADGVAMAAVQGLYQVVKEKEQRIVSLEARLAALESGGAPAPSASTSQAAGGAATSSWAMAGIAALVAAAVTGPGAYCLRRRPAA